MEGIISHNDAGQWNDAATDNIYELPDWTLSKKKEECCASSSGEQVVSKKKKGLCCSCFNVLITIFALMIFVLALTSPIFYFSSQSRETQQNEAIEALSSGVNSSSKETRIQTSELASLIQVLQEQLIESNQRYQENIEDVRMLLQLLTNTSGQNSDHVVRLEALLQHQFNNTKDKIQEQASVLREYIQDVEHQLNNTSRALLQHQFNNTLSNDKIQEQASVLREYIQDVEHQLNNTRSVIDNIVNLIPSCKNLPQNSPSGYYHVQTSTGIIYVYCDTDRRTYCNCTTTGGWMRVANLDMRDPTQQCPDGFKLINRTEPPLRTCGRPGGSGGCVNTSFPVYGTEYSRVCGRIVANQIGSPDSFASRNRGIDSHYVSGISLTHGIPRQHIWTFANAYIDGALCPCVQDSNGVPQFVGNDYFCDSAIRSGYSYTNGLLYPDDPLWDGRGCGSTTTCCEFNNPPWFCKELSQPTTDDIEMRLCENSLPRYDDSPFEVVELYIN